ncbi:MobF family relaxase [Nocardia sp. NPDC059246]|uniref:MobF family relaxase n=1 Tax=unclassified Nocardia TaxID=2637762 RepID=UPI0036B56976
MVGNLHKLSAGDGYTYLTKQVAVMDSSELGTSSLGDYYSMKGEAPGQWIGAGLAAFEDISAGDTVTEDQMKALFGLGRNPHAKQIEADKIAELVGPYLQRYLARGHPMNTAVKKARDRAATEALAFSRLGQPFRVYKQASEFRQNVATAYSDRNTSQGLPWRTALPVEERTRLRTKVATAMFAEQYGRDPLDDRELSGFIATNSRQRTQACAGYDFTVAFPDKSWHALWALAPRDVADILFNAHVRAAQDTVRFAEKVAVYTRVGANGVAQVDVTGLVATIFHHRDSRNGDPYLHSHIALSNKVRTLDGRWLALDGQTLYKFAVWLSEYYATRSVTYAREDLARAGFHIATYERPHIDATKRGTTAVAGIDTALCDWWSSRNAAIDVCRGELAREFQKTNGREPSPREAYELAERASLATRPHKHLPRSEAEQRHAWHNEALEVRGSEQAVTDMIHTTLHAPPAGPDTEPLTEELLDIWIALAADRVVERVSSDRATWQINHVGAEAERVVRAAELAPQLLEDTVAQVIAAALDPSRSTPLNAPDVFDEPRPLGRIDGTSVFTRAGSQTYTSTPILDAENRILAAAARRDGRRASDIAVDLALLEYAANEPTKPLVADQTALVREFASSGARVQLALAPAGTGKTTAMKVFTRAWGNDGGTVIGLAPTAAAAAVLWQETGATCDTIDKLTYSLKQAAAAAPNGFVATIPDWVTAIDEHTMVVVDEAALASTHQLDQVIDYVLGRGGSVRLIGDDKQLSSVAAGGIVRAIADTYGALTLGHVVRFRDRHGNPRLDEGAASLALREGDPAAIGYYIDHGRVHSGDLAALIEDAYCNWSADQRRGLDSVLMAPTRAITRELNQRARRDRLATTGVWHGREIALNDGTSVCAGDIIRTTTNQRRLALSGTDWVRNGYRWVVDEVHDDGSLAVTHLRTKLSIRLPADYVAESVLLGYASTIGSSQGITADTGHTVFSGAETRNDLYTAVTRGIRENHLYGATALTGDEHSIISDKAMNPLTAVDFFTRMLGRDGAQKAATTLIRELNAPETRLGLAVDAYVHAIGAAAEHLLGPEAMARIDTEADTVHAALTDCAAWPTLRKHLSVIALTGTDPIAALTAARNSRELDTAVDAAAVLDWRLDSTGNHSTGTGPLPWLTGIPDTLLEHPDFGTYLRARAGLVEELAQQVETSAATWTSDTAPRWARPLLDADNATLIGQVAVWRAATGVEDSVQRPTGADRSAIRERHYQRELADRIAALLGENGRATSRWRPLANRIEPRLLDDPFWPTLADRLDTAARTGINVARLADTLAAEFPLPDQMPAAALWWRLARQLPTPNPTPADDPTQAAVPESPTDAAHPDTQSHADELLDTPQTAHEDSPTTAPSTTRRNPEDPDTAPDPAAQRLQQMTTRALVDEIDTLRTQLGRIRSEITRSGALTANAVADQVRDDHHQLHMRADAITVARAAQQSVQDAAAQLDEALAELAALRSRQHDLNPRRRSEAADLAAAIETAEDKVADLREPLADAKADARTAYDHAIELGAAYSQWDAILAAVADPGSLDAELAAAITEDAERAQRLDEQHTQLHELIAALEAALTEQRRRDNHDGPRSEQERQRRNRLDAAAALGDPTPVVPHKRTSASARRRPRRNEAQPTRRRGPTT